MIASRPLHRILPLVVCSAWLLLPATAHAQVECRSEGDPALTAPDDRYTVTEPDPTNHPGDRIVEDVQTGLIWKQCLQGRSGADCATGSSDELTWSEALTAANSATHAGFDDWRLPTAIELTSLLETSCYAPSINRNRFPGDNAVVWTATTSAGEPGSAWAVTTFEGSLFAFEKSLHYSARLVRGGQGFAAFAAEGDHVPDAFGWSAQTGVASATTVTSDSVALSGLTTVTGIRISGAADSSYSINGGPFTSTPGSVVNGDSITVRHTSASAAATTVTSVLTIGGVTGEFSSTTAALVPGAPVIGMATAGNTTATVSFSAPGDDGGAAITGYTVTSSPAGGVDADAGSTSLSHLITNLANGTEYTFTVTATNSAGTGPASSASNVVTPFENSPPTLVTPAAQALLEDATSEPIAITVGDTETAAGNLTLTASSGNTDLIGDAALAAGLAGSGTLRTLTLAPAADRNGPATITLSVTDGDGATTSTSFELDVIAVNDPPGLSIIGSRQHAPSSAGSQTVSGFATATSGPLESGQLISFALTELVDRSDVVSAAGLSADGTLTYVLTGNNGAALFRILAEDDGGTANGGNDTALPQDFVIVVGSGVNLQVRVRRVQPSTKDLIDALTKGTTLANYAVEVTNNGPDDVAGLTIEVAAPDALTDVLWTCLSPAGACTPASGSTSVATTLDLDLGQIASVQISGQVDSSENFVEITATARLPQGVTALSTGQERFVFIEPANAQAIHRNGFE